jgi:aldose 1-epimerase
MQPPFSSRVGLVALFLLGHAIARAAEAPAKNQSKLSIENSPFGRTQDGEPVELYALKNASGLTAKVITYGAIIYSFEAPDKDGRLVNVNANCASLGDYEKRSPCFGALIGRFANRIALSEFSIEGRKVLLPKNAAPHHIHGGERGFNKRVWKVQPIRGGDFVGLKLTYVSKDG